MRKLLRKLNIGSPTGSRNTNTSADASAVFSQSQGAEDRMQSSSVENWQQNGQSNTLNNHTKSFDQHKIEESESQDANKEQEKKWKSAFDRHSDFIIDRMTSEFGLIDKLYARNVLTDEEKDEIQAKKQYRKMNRLLIKLLSQHYKLKELAETMKLSGQRHLVKFLEYDGIYREETDGEWPLTDREILTLRNNHEYLMEHIDTTELCPKLFSTGVIDTRQREFVYSMPTQFDKVDALLNILRRGSLKSYWQTIRCLNQNKQGYVAELLEKDGVIVHVDAKFKETQEFNASETEKKFATEIYNLLSGTSFEESSRIFERVKQMKLIGAKEGHSVRLYYLCNLSKEVDLIEQMAKDGRLKEFVNSLFHLLVKSPIKIEIDLNWRADVFNVSRSILRSVNNKISLPETAPTITNLPLEVLDVILQKSVSLNIHRKINNFDESFCKLANVEFCWFKRIISQRFKMAVWSYLSDIHYNKSPGLQAYRDNKQYLEQNLILFLDNKQLHKQSDLFSDLEYEIISRNWPSSVKKRRSTKKGLHLLDILTSSRNELKMRSIIREIHQSRWDIMDEGGVAVKVEFKRRGSTEKRANQELVNGFNALNDRLNLRSNDTEESKEIEKVIMRLKNLGLKLLNSVEDRNGVVWIWCKSTAALAKLIMFQFIASENLSHLFCQLSGRHVQSMQGIDMNIDKDQLRKVPIASTPHVIVESVSTINLQEKFLVVRGVTKVKNRIYSLYVATRGTFHTYLFVFDERNLSFPIQKLEFSEIRSPKFIASHEKENNLYILENCKCVWNIKGDKIDQRAIEWLKLGDDFRPTSMSVNRVGHLLMIDRIYPFTLRIYGSDAQLVSNVAFHEAVEYPFHAIEAPNGNFVVSHWLANKQTGKQSQSNWVEKSMSTVSILSQDGKKIIHQFVPRYEDQKLKRFSDNYFCIDSNDRVFLSDAGNGRVILLNYDLSWKQELFEITKKKCQEDRMEVQKLYYDEGNKQLFVCSSSQIDMYTLINKS